MFVITSRITDESLQQVLNFMSETYINVEPGLLTFGLTLGYVNGHQALNKEAVYQICPTVFRVTHNPRTNNLALFWFWDRATEATLARMQELAAYERPISQEPLILTNRVDSYKRNIKAALNSRENALISRLGRADQFVLTFEGEFEFPAADLTPLPTLADIGQNVPGLSS